MINLKLLLRLWLNIQLKYKKHVLYLTVLMILTSFIEVVTIGALLPFITVLTDPTLLLKNELINNSFLSTFIHKHLDNNYLIYVIAFFFGLVVIIASIMRLFLLKISTNVAFNIGADLGAKAYKNILYQDYQVHITKNSNEIINVISNKIIQVINGALMPVLLLITNLFMLAAIVIVLFYINPLVATTVFFGFAAIYISITWATARIKIENSYRISRESSKVVKSIQDGIGGIRDIIIDNNQEIYCREFEIADKKLRQAQSINQFLGQSPRYVIESLGVVFLTILACSLSLEEGGLISQIPILAVIALGIQRLLPIMQQIYGAFSSIQGFQGSLADVITLLEESSQERSEQKSGQLKFEQLIELDDVFFSYNSTYSPVLKGINLKIRHGETIGFVGLTGAGKSTLVDIIMGLIEPSSGKIKVDGIAISGQNRKAWMKNVAHVPQNIFLANATIAENIAFGVPIDQINFEVVSNCAKKAMLDELIESWPDKYKTTIGERGIKLSGGQKQRIGIARAFYKDTNLIIFDEATSSLDHDTEGLIMKSIENLNQEKTILIIAHRTSTLRQCNFIVTLESGMIKKVTSKDEFFKV